MTIAMVVRLAVYFFAGVVQDFLVTMNMRYVAKEKIMLAIVSSFLITVVGTIVLYNIITGLDPSKSVVAIIVYALGIAGGTYLAMKFKAGFND